MPDDARHGSGRGRGGPLQALVFGAVLIIGLPQDGDRHEGGDRTPCAVASWSADGLSGEFARYGDDATRIDDWTGGDGTHSTRLPHGRALWLFSDTYGPAPPPGRARAGEGGPRRAAARSRPPPTTRKRVPR